METSELYNLYHTLRDIGLRPLPEVIRLTDLILGEKSSEINEKQRYFLERVRRNCSLSLDAWSNLPDHRGNETSDFHDFLYIALRYEGYQPLREVSGLIDLLLSENVGPINEKQRYFLEIVKRQCGLSLHAWDYPLVYLRWPPGKDLSATTLSEVLQSVLSYAKRDLFINSLSIKISDNISTVRFDNVVIEAITCLMLWDDQMPDDVTISAWNDDIINRMCFEVEVLSEGHRSHELRPNEATAGTRLHCANAIIIHFGGQLEAVTSDRGVKFKFALRPS